MKNRCRALLIFAFSLAAAGPLYAVPPCPGFSNDLDGWEGAPWGASLSSVQARYGIEAGTTIYSQDDFKIVMDAHRRLDTVGTFAKETVDIAFHFDREDRLKAVTISSKAPVSGPIFISSLEEVLGRGGTKPLRGISGESIPGEDRLWVRKAGTARLETGSAFTRLNLARREPPVFPDALFAAFDEENEEAFLWYLDAGMGHETYTDFLMDEEGTAVEASISDYVLLAIIEERDGLFPRRCLSILADRKIAPSWYPENLVSWFLNTAP